jgi:hypothetical protein
MSTPTLRLSRPAAATVLHVGRQYRASEKAVVDALLTRCVPGDLARSSLHAALGATLARPCSSANAPGLAFGLLFAVSGELPYQLQQRSANPVDHALGAIAL